MQVLLKINRPRSVYFFAKKSFKKISVNDFDTPYPRNSGGKSHFEKLENLVAILSKSYLKK